MDDLPSPPIVPSSEATAPAAQLLAYENPVERIKRDPPPSVLGNTFLYLIGFAFSTVGVAILCGPLALANYGSRFSSVSTGIIAATAFLLAIAALARLVYVLRNRAFGSTDRPWFFYGVLLGCGLMLLVEGSCFLRQMPH